MKALCPESMSVKLAIDPSGFGIILVSVFF